MTVAEAVVTEMYVEKLPRAGFMQDPEWNSSKPNVVSKLRVPRCRLR